MDIGQMKNIVILKNLPSNIVEEAIVVLRPNKKAPKLQYVKQKNEETKKIEPKKGYIIKEAEMVIGNYAKEIEEEKKHKQNNTWEKKYNVQKYISLGLAIIALIEFIII